LGILVLPPIWADWVYNKMIEAPIAVGLGCVNDRNPEHEKWDLVCKRNEAEPDQWLISIGGDVMSTGAAPCLSLGTPTKDPMTGEILTGGAYCFSRVRVQGGLNIPFYFVFISLLGAAVSMIRRIPEYQRKASDDPTFTPGMAREKMVTQVVQFLSAPLIATTVYMLIMPESPSASIAVAFISGFSSDLVIKTISYAADQFETGSSNEAK